MDENRNNRSVERKMKEALKSDRARIQVGRISHFGLLEMSRQRIRSSVLESSTEICPHCNGTGHVRSVSSVALQLVRSLEETLLKGATHNLIVRTRSDVAIYVLNHKRAHLRMLEERFRVAITITTDPTLTGHPPFAIDRGEQVMTLEQAKALVTVKPDSVAPYAEEEEEDEIVEEETEETVEAEGETESADAEQSGSGERKGRRRRRGRRGRGRDSEARDIAAEQGEDTAAASDEDGGEADMPGTDEEGRETRADAEGRKRRRGRRGGRRNRRGRDENGNDHPRSADEQETHDESPAYQAAEQPQESSIQEAAAADEQPRYETPPAEPAASLPSATETDDRPRRRSTVREPAPVFDNGSDTPPPAPPASAPAPTVAPATSETAEVDKPRRFGWWSKRG
jgi:ribonuclease E